MPAQSLPDGIELGLPALGPYRLAALLHALKSLRGALRDLGSDLITAKGSTDVLLQQMTTILAQNQPSSVDLHFYPSLDQEEYPMEVATVESFLETARACGIPATARPSSEANNVLYQPSDISSALLREIIPGNTENSSLIATSVEESGDNNNNIIIPQSNSNSLAGVFKLLESKPTMTDFRSTIQQITAVRRPLPAPSTLPPLFENAKQILENSSSRNNLDLNAISNNCWRDIYTNAGAKESLDRLEELIGHRIEIPTSPSESKSTLNMTDRLVDVPPTNSYVQQLPIAPAEVEQRLKIMLQGGADDLTPFMNTYKDSRMMAGNSIESSAVLSAALSLGTVSARAVYWRTLDSMMQETNQRQRQEEKLNDSPGSGELLAIKNGQKEGGSSENVSNEKNTTGVEADAAAVEKWQWSEPTKASPGHHWLLMHLGIRDFFTYYALKAGKCEF